MKIKGKLFLFLSLASSFVNGELSIDEKLDRMGNQKGYSSEEVKGLHEELYSLRQELRNTYKQVEELVSSEAREGEYSILLQHINALKEKILQREVDWKERFSNKRSSSQEVYALFDQEETTIAQLVTEYGSQDFLYVIPPEVGAIKISMQSAIAIPRESWREMLDLILQLNGVGIREINPFARQLFLLKQDLVTVKMITSSKEDLALVPDHIRIMHMFSAPVENIRNTYYFFDRFRDIKRTFAYQIGSKIALVGTKDDILKLISMYDQAYDEKSDKVTKVVTLQKLSPDEMKNVLKSYFGGLAETTSPMMGRSPIDLNVLPLGQESGIVLIGSRRLVDRAEEIIKEMEEQLEDPSEMTVFWYTCRHSEPNDLAEVLEQVYASLTHYSLEGGDIKKEALKESDTTKEILLDELTPPPYPAFDNTPRGIINPPQVNPGTPTSTSKVVKTKSFIPYGKAGGIMMVVRKDTLVKLKELLAKLDVPKKMVHLEVILAEKRLVNNTNAGLNLLKLGSNASNTKTMGGDFLNQPGKEVVRGIFEFFFTRPESSSFPAIDMTYNFLMNQEDIRINNSPSVTTVNQTPATISVVEEISINNGAAPVDSNKGVIFEKSYSRQQYGVTIVMTPTVHEPDEKEEGAKSFVTLDTNITFDTINSDVDDRPNVNRRHIENHVRVVDGETIILGGLKRKDSHDRSEKVPFLGEIPGFGKLFGATQMTDHLTDMYVFITPRVINDPKADLEKIRQEELCRRPGDLPAFLECKKEAKQKEKQRLFNQSLKLLFGNSHETKHPSQYR